MDIEKIANDSRALAKRTHELVGAWDPCDLVTALCVNVGSLAETIMVLEHKRHPREGAPAQIERNIAGTLYALMELSISYEIDLERAWNETIQGGWLKLAKLENRGRDQKGE
jgi:hypothetical protein